MRAFLLCLLLVGCATVEPKEEFKAVGGINKMAPVELDFQLVPESPTAYRIVQDEQVYGGFNKEGLDRLIKLRQVARENTAKLEQMVLATNALIDERNNLVEMLRLMEEAINTLLTEAYEGEKAEARQAVLLKVERLAYQASILSSSFLF